jgi:catechol 2,3-dioxygenase-like lactoylglutathione lyase family enzyme
VGSCIVAASDTPPPTEVKMGSTDVSNEATSRTQSSLGVDMNLEVVTLPVSDVDRAKNFYENLGWRLDIDLVVSDDVRTVQFTPPHSGCSVQIGKGGTTAEPGSAQGLILVVSDIEAARDDLISRGVDVSTVQEARPPGFEQAGRSYFARASFSDPDGNGWVLQEVTTRLPGREWQD